MSVHWNTFTKALKDSFLALDRKYFKVERFEAESRYFERVYCYELYHQLRKHLDPIEGFPYYLHGEIDKDGHDVVKTALGAGLKPDFIIHDPGFMDNDTNLAVMEVKTIYQVYEADYAMDHLRKFLHKVEYSYGIQLIFGDDERRDLPKKLKDYDEDITVLWHREVGKVPIQWAGPKIWPEEDKEA